jgi:5'-phosphate synthase pdxT subunit
MKTIGVLALQGCVDPHLSHLSRIGVKGVSVRYASELAALDGIILPGGESTTMLRLLRVNELFEPLRIFLAQKPAWGICAGSILLAEEVANPEQEALGLAAIRAERNAYGSQLDSFQATLTCAVLETPLCVDFIRAPKLTPLQDRVRILAEHGSVPVLLRDRHILCSAFHTELGDDSGLHEFFCREFVS